MDPVTAAPDGGPDTPGCVVEHCPVPMLGVACCTALGTGEPGNILEPVGRVPGVCGTNLGGVDDSLEDVCIQLSQPGVLDPSCPPQAPISGGPRMPGCCTDEGFCGSFDNIVPFGCFYATGMRGAPCDPTPDADAGT